MADAEKTALKLLIADKILEEINEAAANAEKNHIAARASMETVKRILDLYKPYQKKILDALENGTFPAGAKDAVLGVYADMVQLTDKTGRAAATAYAETGPFSKGLRKAADIVEDFKRRAVKQDEVRAREEVEEDEYRKGLVEDSPPVETPPKEQDASNADLPPAEESPIEIPVDLVVEPPVENHPEIPIDPAMIPAEAAPEAKAICPHCGDIIEVETGSTLCFACISYKNKHNRLPSQATLRKRRGV